MKFYDGLLNVMVTSILLWLGLLHVCLAGPNMAKYGGSVMGGSSQVLWTDPFLANAHGIWKFATTNAVNPLYNDSGPLNNKLTSVGTIWIPASNGVVAHVRMDGSDDRLYAQQIFYPSSWYRAHVMSGWFYWYGPTAGSQYLIAPCRDTSVLRGFEIFVWAGSTPANYVSVTKPGYWVQSCGFSLPISNWMHVVYINSVGGMFVFTNGVQAWSRASDQFVQNISVTAVGNGWNGGGVFNGEMYRPAVYYNSNSWAWVTNSYNNTMPTNNLESP